MSLHSLFGTNYLVSLFLFSLVPVCRGFLQALISSLSELNPKECILVSLLVALPLCGMARVRGFFC